MEYLFRVKDKIRIVNALMLRDAMARFGRENLGFFWLVGEPLIVTLGIIVIWSAVGATHGHANINVVAFALSGYTLLTLWRRVVSRAVHCFRQSSGMMFHRDIYFLDVLVARTIIEMLGSGAAFFVAYVPFYLFGYLEPIYDPLTLIGAWVLMVLVSFSVGLIIACVTEMYEPAEYFVHPVMYLILPLTGAFYMVDWLPFKYQQLAIYNPLINLNEMFRHGLYGEKVRTYWDVSIVVMWILPLLAVGFLLAPVARLRMRFE